MTTTETPLKVGDEAPDLELRNASGGLVRLSAMWGERPLAVVFLCPLDGQYCSDQALQLRDAYGNFEKAGGDLVAVAAGTPEEADDFRKRWNIPYALCAEPEEGAYMEFGVTGELPGSFVIDTEGVIRYARRNRDALDNPSTWSLVDVMSALTGQTVEKPKLATVGPEAPDTNGSPEATPAVPTPGSPAALNYTCAKCGNTDYEVLDVSTASGMLSRMVNFQHRRFSAVICRRCSYTEFYKTDSSALRNVFDLLAGA
jgi:peroxiredoxin/predicted nucleic-acid-binding Zn-ribbon protein